MEQVYHLQTADELKALAHPLRIQIVFLLTEQPMTNKQIAEALGEDPARLHFHVRELFNAGIIKLVEERPKGGVLEKYYRAIAKSYDAASVLPANREYVASLGAGAFDSAKRNYIRAQDAGLTKPGAMSYSHIKVNKNKIDEIENLIKQILDKTEDDDEDGLEYSLTIAFHPRAHQPAKVEGKKKNTQ